MRRPSSHRCRRRSTWRRAYDRRRDRGRVGLRDQRVRHHVGGAHCLRPVALRAGEADAATMTPRMQRTLFLIGALSISGTALAVIATGNMGKNLVYYWSPTEMAAAGDKALGATIRLG